MTATSIIVPIEETRVGDDQGVGTRREYNGKVYIWAKFSAGADTPSKGDALGYVSSSFDGYTVTSDVSAAIADVLAGAIQNESDTEVPSDGEYFWMQVKGPITLANTVADSAAAGDAICLDTAADGTAGKAGASEPGGGWLIDATAKTVILNCPDYVYSA